MCAQTEHVTKVSLNQYAPKSETEQIDPNDSTVFI